MAAPPPNAELGCDLQSWQAMKTKLLDQRWQQLMTLCESEARFKREGIHPRLLRHVSSEIIELATEMGFSPRCIETREFRAERERGRIVRILTDG
jgi:hypothetical protein